ncbi:uncharacterized protein LOC110926798 [Helianthus annuus]|uniref:uncharacterized protein LOC110926798 n=1 Tax=Helianthus annuus TaxID=4232 RepID=UPI0016530112|nr:uncharacterized protein LOC110926798 [Helianthus annuus]
MSFGLKNAGATYQRLMDKIFAEDIGKHIEVYIDDLVIKSPEEDQMLKDIEKTFNSLRSVNMKLNPAKCSFGMEEGKFLGFVVTNGGFKVNPEKVQAIERMPSPRTIKEMQRLVGRLAALNRFLSNHAAKSYPFISTLRNCVKNQEFKWTPEAETAFQQMKECLIKLPTLTAPFEKEPLILYLSSSDKAVGSVLLVERDGVQTPIYYVSRVLTDPETRYSTMEKLVLALLHASRRLRRYFTGHVITVLTNFHIGTILQKPETSGRPCPAIKGQVLADFVTEVPVDKIKDCEIVETPVKDTSNELWLLYTDGASNEDGAGAGLCLVSPKKHEFTYAIKLDFKNTNNEAEYEAFLVGLRLAEKMGAQNLRAHVDSLLIASQISGLYVAKGEVMALYLDQAKELLQQFKSYKVVHINRSENKPVDALSKLASTSFQHLAKDVRIKVLKNPSVLLHQVNVIEIGQSSWMTPIIQYLQDGILPESKAEARKIQNKALHYEMNGDILYRKSFLGPLCVDPQDANYLVREIHEGIYGMHVDALKELRKCDSSQRHSPKTLRPKNDLIPVSTAWPFQQWGIDMVGPFPEAPGAVKFIIVAVDYFTKWVEAKALASTTAMMVRKFIWEHIICRFGLPLKIVTDNGTNFASDDLQKWMKEMKIEHTFSSVAHPQGNGQVESVNKSIVDGIKARLGTKRRGWKS